MCFISLLRRVLRSRRLRICRVSTKCGTICRLPSSSFLIAKLRIAPDRHPLGAVERHHGQREGVDRGVAGEFRIGAGDLVQQLVEMPQIHVAPGPEASLAHGGVRIRAEVFRQVAQIGQRVFARVVARGDRSQEARHIDLFGAHIGDQAARADAVARAAGDQDGRTALSPKAGHHDLQIDRPDAEHGAVQDDVERAAVLGHPGDEHANRSFRFCAATPEGRPDGKSQPAMLRLTAAGHARGNSPNDPPPIDRLAPITPRRPGIRLRPRDGARPDPARRSRWSRPSPWSGRYRRDR